MVDQPDNQGPPSGGGSSRYEIGHNGHCVESKFVTSTRRERMFEIRNPKHETRNKFEITSTKIQNGSTLDTQQLLPVSLILF